jgi:aryl-alcohol dehydrogenase-like predicted oxidoreductase
MSPLAPWTRRRGDAPPRLALGTMNFGKRTDERESIRVIERALERGVTLFDTANAYVDGESERILGRALRGRRASVAIATKVGFGRVAGAPEGLSRLRVLAALDESLARLGADHVDLYYLHVPDHATPIDETLSAIEALLASGKIKAYGVSNYASWQILEIFHLADRRGLPRPVIAQQLYNLLIRQLDVEYAAFSRAYGLHTTVYNALAGGLLTGRHDPRAPIPAGSRFDKNRLYQGRYWSDRFFDLVEGLRGVAERQGMSLLEMAYAWLAQSPVVDSILLGPASVAQLDQALDACARRVSPEGLREIDSLHKAYLGTETTYAR